jgi:hypothetical protein
MSRFHLAMIVGVAWLGVLTCAGYWVERCQGGGAELLALGVVLAGAVPFPLYLREKGRPGHADAILALMWGAVLIALVPVSVEVGARLELPLQDALLVTMDKAVGMSVPGIALWSATHGTGWLVSSTYPLLLWILPVALFLPALAGRAKVTREFVLSNLIAFAIGLPVFALMPAVGPWYGFHTAASHAQLAVQGELLALRNSATHAFQLAGVICFPSFHVIWAILAARALWTFRWLRIPSTLLCAMIALSTLTSGWHYFADVLAGSVLAAFAILISKAVEENSERRRLLGPSPDPINTQTI